jgi:hypothetical protein
LVISLTGCSSSTKNITDDVQEESAEITATSNKQQITPEVSPAESTGIPSKETPEITPESSSEATPIINPEEAAAEENSVTPSVDDGSNHIIEDNSEDRSSLMYPYRAYTILPGENETAQFNRFYYMDNQNCLNTFFWKYNKDLKFTSCVLYKEQSDGSIKDTKITWDNEADKIISLVKGKNKMFSIMSQWIDEDTGDFYMIVCKWTFDAEDNPTFLYGIHPDGKLFVNIRMEDCLIMDKISSRMDACGYTINYLAQKNGVAYFEYSDDSHNAVVYYDMKNDCFIKQIFTDFTVKGIIDDQYVGINEKQLILGRIPADKELEEPTDNSILTGNSEILQKYNLPDYEGICVNRKYVYLLTKNNFQRIIPGEDDWEVLDDVSQVTNGSMISDEIGGDLYLNDLIVKDEHTFSILWYADCGDGYFIDIYCLE